MNIARAFLPARRQTALMSTLIMALLVAALSATLVFTGIEPAFAKTGDADDPAKKTKKTKKKKTKKKGAVSTPSEGAVSAPNDRGTAFPNDEVTALPNDDEEFTAEEATAEEVTASEVAPASTDGVYAPSKLRAREINNTAINSSNQRTLEPDKSTIKLAWTDNATNETGYKIWYSKEDNFDGWKSKPIVALPGSGKTWVHTITDLATDERYTFEIYACKGTLCSESNYASATPRRQYNDATHFQNTLDYGLYWFQDDMNGVKANTTDTPNDYYDPKKPTVIYVHGYQPEGKGVKGREDFVARTFFAPQPIPDRSMGKPWKNQGYNIGIFFWNQFADEDGQPPDWAESKIYDPGSMRWRGEANLQWNSWWAGKGRWESNGTWRYDGYGEGKSVGDLFLDDYKSKLKNQTGCCVRIVGHSLGSQLAVQLAYDLDQEKKAGTLPNSRMMPKRVAMLDPFINQSARSYHGGRSNHQVMYDMVQTSKGPASTNPQVLYEYYQTTNLFSGGSLADKTTYTRIHPNYVDTWYTDHLARPVQAHQEVVWWYLSSIQYYSDPDAYENGKYKKRAPSASSTHEQLKAMYGGTSCPSRCYWWEQATNKNDVGPSGSIGNWTYKVSDDSMVRKKRWH